MNQNLNQLLTPSDVAKALRVSTDCVYRKVRAGKIRHLRFGGRILIEPDAVWAYMRGVEGVDRCQNSLGTSTAGATATTSVSR